MSAVAVPYLLCAPIDVRRYQALVTYDEKKSTWSVERLTREQNGGNDEEIARVRAEHPGEPECVVDRRVLGALAPFRCPSSPLLLHSLPC